MLNFDKSNLFICSFLNMLIPYEVCLISPICFLIVFIKYLSIMVSIIKLVNLDSNNFLRMIISPHKLILHHDNFILLVLFWAVSSFLLQLNLSQYIHIPKYLKNLSVILIL